MAGEIGWNGTLPSVRCRGGERRRAAGTERAPHRPGKRSTARPAGQATGTGDSGPERPPGAEPPSPRTGAAVAASCPRRGRRKEWKGAGGRSGAAARRESRGWRCAGTPTDGGWQPPLSGSVRVRGEGGMENRAAQLPAGCAEVHPAVHVFACANAAAQRPPEPDAGGSAAIRPPGPSVRAAPARAPGAHWPGRARAADAFSAREEPGGLRIPRAAGRTWVRGRMRPRPCRHAARLPLRRRSFPERAASLGWGAVCRDEGRKEDGPAPATPRGMNQSGCWDA